MVSEEVSKEFWLWINSWGDVDKHKMDIKSQELFTFRAGYKQAIRDISDRITMVRKEV